MRKIFVLIASCLALLAGVFTAATAQADPPFLMPDTLTSYKFGYTRICVNNGDNSLPINQAAGGWNNKIQASSYDGGGASLRIQYSNNCGNLGYPANKRFNVDTYSAADGACIKITNGYTTTNNGYRVWSNNPYFLINTYAPYYCVDSQQRRNHMTSAAIGEAIGFQTMTTSSWASRVMCNCSVDSVGFASSPEGNEAAALYRGYYIGEY